MNINYALSNELLHLVERNDRRGLYHVKIGDLKRVVTFNIFSLSDGEYDCRQSHLIKTACQAGPYFSSHTSFLGKGATLHRALSICTFYYGMAVKRGYRPQENWLVPYTPFSELLH